MYIYSGPNKVLKRLKLEIVTNQNISLDKWHFFLLQTLEFAFVAKRTRLLTNLLTTTLNIWGSSLHSNIRPRQLNF